MPRLRRLYAGRSSPLFATRRCCAPRGACCPAGGKCCYPQQVWPWVIRATHEYLRAGRNNTGTRDPRLYSLVPFARERTFRFRASAAGLRPHVDVPLVREGGVDWVDS